MALVVATERHGTGLSRYPIGARPGQSRRAGAIVRGRDTKIAGNAARRSGTASRFRDAAMARVLLIPFLSWPWVVCAHAQRQRHCSGGDAARSQGVDAVGQASAHGARLASRRPLGCSVDNSLSPDDLATDGRVIRRRDRSSFWLKVFKPFKELRFVWLTGGRFGAITLARRPDSLSLRGAARAPLGVKGRSCAPNAVKVERRSHEPHNRLSRVAPHRCTPRRLSVF